jgi:hypothetical protein
MKTIFTKLSIALLAGSVLMAGCKGEDPETKKAATSSGFSAESASELSTMNLTRDEMESIAQAKQSGLDDATLLAMTRSMHKRDLKFDIGFALQLLKQQGMGATAMMQLVDLGAVPRWADDIRALKDAKVDDVTIVELAKLKFQEKKELLSGGEYASLKAMGLSDAGLLTFARKGGTAQQLQQVRQDLALGKSEQEAFKTAGL